MKVRIRPSSVGGPLLTLRINRPASGAHLMLAVCLSSLCVVTALLSFSMLCWKAASDLSLLPPFLFSKGPLNERLTWLMLAFAALLLAKLIDSFTTAPLSVSRHKAPAFEADELPVTRARGIATASKKASFADLL